MPEPGYWLSLSTARQVLALFGSDDSHRLAAVTYLILDAIAAAARGGELSPAPPGSAAEAAARRIARRCVRLIQGCLREEEWPEAVAAFSQVVGEELAGLVGDSVHSERRVAT